MTNLTKQGFMQLKLQNVYEKPTAIMKKENKIVIQSTKT